MFVLRPESPEDGPAVEALLDLCFGPDRLRKVSYRYRTGVARCHGLSMVAEEAEAGLVGAIRYWPLRLNDAAALLLGPLAIHPARQGRGIGRALVFRTLDDAFEMGHRLVFLVGDPRYYARFGFTTAPSSIVMPDEDPRRLQYVALGDGRLPEEGGRLWPLGEGVAGAHAIRYNQPVGA